MPQMTGESSLGGPFAGAAGTSWACVWGTGTGDEVLRTGMGRW